MIYRFHDTTAYTFEGDVLQAESNFQDARSLMYNLRMNNVGDLDLACSYKFLEDGTKIQAISEFGSDRCRIIAPGEKMKEPPQPPDRIKEEVIIPLVEAEAQPFRLDYETWSREFVGSYIIVDGSFEINIDSITHVSEGALGLHYENNATGPTWSTPPPGRTWLEIDQRTWLERSNDIPPDNGEENNVLGRTLEVTTNRVLFPPPGMGLFPRTCVGECYWAWPMDGRHSDLAWGALVPYQEVNETVDDDGWTVNENKYHMALVVNDEHIANIWTVDQLINFGWSWAYKQTSPYDMGAAVVFTMCVPKPHGVTGSPDPDSFAFCYTYRFPEWILQCDDPDGSSFTWIPGWNGDFFGLIGVYCHYKGRTHHAVFPNIEAPDGLGPFPHFGDPERVMPVPGFEDLYDEIRWKPNFYISNVEWLINEYEVIYVEPESVGISFTRFGYESEIGEPWLFGPFLMDWWDYVWDDHYDDTVVPNTQWGFPP